ncbi:MAG: putative DNA binding domain-containing protein [Candidatus Methanoplasma sp.]|nr:putative DNA binding domain-containing protein [Candidatus Methanoplasma sp.]
MEHQTVEWKEKWSDEFLKGICGFANSQGGRLEIGRTDDGEVIGVSDPRRLLDELPNKIKATMGIICEVSLCHEGGLPYIAIQVHPHPNGITYRGRYYVRSGGTTQELTGHALDEFILRKHGKTWDSAPVPGVSAGDIYHDAFAVFREKAVRSGRLKREDVDVSDADLLSSLKLADGGRVSRAAVLLFHMDPERFCLGSYVKIGFFESECEIRYQDEINGPILNIPDRVIDTIYTKYFKGLICYDGMQRIDRYPMPREALKEAVLNAVVHRSYETGSPVQIKVFSDRVYVFNDARLPPGTTDLDLQREHRSAPHNPLIANAFFRSGQIEAWGRGIGKIKAACREDGLPEPEFRITETGFEVCFRIRDNDRILRETTAADMYVRDGGLAERAAGELAESEAQRKVLRLMAARPGAGAEAIAAEACLSLREVRESIGWAERAGIAERASTPGGPRWVLRCPAGRGGPSSAETRAQI